jgi:hypothetical protein
MRKTMLALTIGASVLSIPAFAQVQLGGVGQAGVHVGAGLPVGAAVQDSARTLDQAGMRAGDTARAAGRRTGHAAHRAMRRSGTTVGGDAAVDADASTRAGGADARAGIGLNTAATAGQAGESGRGVGGQVRDAAHSAIQATDRTAGSVGDAVRSAAAGASAGADARVSAEGGAHDH